MKTFLSLLLVVLSLIGILDASYITYEKITGQIPPCGAGFNCGGVLESPWAYIGPIPLSVYGLFFYSLVFVIAVANFLEVDIKAEVTRISDQYQISIPAKLIPYLINRRLFLVLTTFGFGFSLYLVGLMAFVIQAWCLYCLVSAGTCLSLFITSIAFNRVTATT